MGGMADGGDDDDDDDSSDSDEDEMSEDEKYAKLARYAKLEGLCRAHLQENRRGPLWRVSAAFRGTYNISSAIFPPAENRYWYALRMCAGLRVAAVAGSRIRRADGSARPLANSTAEEVIEVIRRLAGEPTDGSSTATLREMIASLADKATHLIGRVASAANDTEADQDDASMRRRERGGISGHAGSRLELTAGEHAISLGGKSRSNTRVDTTAKVMSGKPNRDDSDDDMSEEEKKRMEAEEAVEDTVEEDTTGCPSRNRDEITSVSHTDDWNVCIGGLRCRAPSGDAGSSGSDAGGRMLLDPHTLSFDDFDSDSDGDGLGDGTEADMDMMFDSVGDDGARPDPRWKVPTFQHLLSIQKQYAMQRAPTEGSGERRDRPSKKCCVVHSCGKGPDDASARCLGPVLDAEKDCPTGTVVDRPCDETCPQARSPWFDTAHQLDPSMQNRTDSGSDGGVSSPGGDGPGNDDGPSTGGSGPGFPGPATDDGPTGGSGIPGVDGPGTGGPGTGGPATDDDLLMGGPGMGGPDSDGGVGAENKRKCAVCSSTASVFARAIKATVEINRRSGMCSTLLTSDGGSDAMCSAIAVEAGLEQGSDEWKLFSHVCVKALDDHPSILDALKCICRNVGDLKLRILWELLSRIECIICREHCKAAGVDICEPMRTLQLDGSWRETYYSTWSSIRRCMQDASDGTTTPVRQLRGSIARPLARQLQRADSGDGDIIAAIQQSGGDGGASSASETVVFGELVGCGEVSSGDLRIA